MVLPNWSILLRYFLRTATNNDVTSAMAEEVKRFTAPSLEPVDCPVELVVSFSDPAPEGAKVFTFRWTSGRPQVEKTPPLEE